MVLPASLMFGLIYLAHKYPTYSSRAILLKLRGAKKRHNWKSVKSPQVIWPAFYIRLFVTP